MKTLSTDELTRLVNELASFSRSDIPMPNGLRQLHDSLRPGKLRNLADELGVSLNRGVSLSDAFKDASVRVPPEFISLVRCGEISGDMRAVLRFAVEHARRVQRHRARALSALFYPCVVLTFLVAFLLLLSNVICPAFQDIFRQLGADHLPELTQGVFYVARFTRGVPGAIFAATLLGLFLAAVFSERGRRMFPAIFGAIGYFHSLIRLSDAAILSKFVSVMSARGVELPTALRAAALAVWRPRTRQALNAMANAAEQGRTLGPMVDDVLPATPAYLFRQAEQRGDLSETCAGIAEYCEDRFDLLSESITGILEPLMVVVMGAVAGFVIVSLYLPLFSIPKLIQG
jgi:type IV pilus assembly protein PilC